MIDNRFYESFGPYALSDLVADLDCEPIEGRLGDTDIVAVSELSISKPGDLSFLANRKYLSALDTAGASACLVTEELADKVGAKNIVPIVVKSPRASFGRLLSKLYSPRALGTNKNQKIADSAFIHSTAVLGDNVVIGEGVYIGPHCVIGTGVEIGANSQLLNNVTIECAVIGENCYFKAGATIGTIGFAIDGDSAGLVELPHLGRAILGDRVRIGANSCVDRGLLKDTIIEDDVKLDNLVQIGHNVRIGARAMLAAFVGIPGSCDIGCDVIMGGGSAIADHLTIGDGARIAGKSAIMHNVPAGETWSGFPAMPIRQHMRYVSEMRKVGQGKAKSKKTKGNT